MQASMVTKERYGDYKEVKEIFLEHLVESDCGYKAGAGGRGQPNSEK